MTTVWVNGRLVDPDRPALLPLDRGFTLGDGLFETMRAYGGRIFRLQEHLARLEAGLLRLELPVPAGLKDAVLETLAASGHRDAMVRLTVSRGPDGEDGLEATSHPTVVVSAKAYAPDPRWYEDGIRAAVVSARVNEFAATAGLKQIGYLEPLRAQAEAKAAGADEAIRLDTQGHVAEGGMSNVFLVVEGVLRTAPASCGILPGITRAAVLELAGDQGLEVFTAPIPPSALERASEIFITSSLRELVPVTRLNGRPVGDGRPGPITLRLLAAYRALTRETGTPS